MYSNYNDKFRSKCVDKLNEYINNESKSRKIEKGIYNFIINYAKENNLKRSWNDKIFQNLYFSKVRSICLNLNKDSYIKNNYLIKKVIDNEIDPESISKLSIYDIFPENWKSRIDAKTKIDKLKYELKPEAMTDQYKCRRCGSRKCSYYELQTRSADEPMTQFFTCLDCQTRWKM